MEVSRLLEFYWQALLPSVNRLEKTLPRLYQTGEGSSKHSDSVIGSGSGILGGDVEEIVDLNPRVLVFRLELGL